MNSASQFPGMAVVIGALLALIVVALIVWRVLRTKAAARLAQSTPQQSEDDEYLDSSHIIEGGVIRGADGRPITSVRSGKA